MRSRRLRVYADTSVFGGCFDDEFAETSRAFFAEVRAGRFLLVISPVTLRELLDAPEHVRAILTELPGDAVEVLAESQEVLSLRDAYLEAGFVGPGSSEDAEHVASAAVAKVDVIVSWNFRHIVHFEKINGYNGVNLIHGYGALRIHSPREVVDR